MEVAEICGFWVNFSSQVAAQIADSLNETTSYRDVACEETGSWNLCSAAQAKQGFADAYRQTQSVSRCRIAAGHRSRPGARRGPQRAEKPFGTPARHRLGG